MSSPFSGNNAPATQTVSPFPQPPEYSLNYTTDNIKNQRTLKPPSIPRKFTIFGEEIDLEGKMIQSLSEIGLQQLYSSTANWKLELKKLNKSVVAAFLDLLEILIKCPDNAERREKIETIRMLFINMHHLINEYRPIQARDTLQNMMIKQNKETKIVTEKMRNYIATSNKAFNKVLATFQESDYDARLPVAPESFTEPPEFGNLASRSKDNDRLTAKGAVQHEYIMQKLTVQRHLQLLQTADGEEQYSETFDNFEIEEDTLSKSSKSEVKTVPPEESNMEFELEELDELEGKSSSEHDENDDENQSDLAVVEFMDDESDNEMMNVLDESDSNTSPTHSDNKGSSASPENTVAIEYPEPPSKFVDDTVAPAGQNQEMVDNFDEALDPDANKPTRSQPPSPENFLEPGSGIS